jgi:cold shock CspA family protein
MPKTGYRRGLVKLFRDDGLGFLIDSKHPHEYILVHYSSIYSKNSCSHRKKRYLKNGQKVLFRVKNILGRKVAIDVRPV